jgi:hypothetical protein
MGPADCAGYWTACGIQVPEHAVEYANWPKGDVASRGPYAWVARYQIDGPLCGNCKRRLKQGGLR